MMDGSALPRPGDTIAGKYVLERVIGEGGMSVVYGATHRVTNKRFAIKWMLPDETPTSGDTARRFIREAQVAGLFQHPNVVEVYDVGQVSGSFYMVMEWLDGESLASRLERERVIAFENACAYLIPCMHGVHEAHLAGIVHRDLKPANIFLCRAMHQMPERPKVLDFGIAKLSKHLFDVNSLVTKSGVLIGTPHYLSPEQLRSQPVDHRTDIYAFGVIMYQLLSGQLPFPADNFGALVLQIATGTPLPLRALVPELPVGVPEIVAKAMAREPDERFQDLRDLIAALEDVARGVVPLIAERAPNAAMAATLEQPKSTPSGLTYPPNASSAVPPPLPSQRTPSAAQALPTAAQRTPSGAQHPSSERTPSGAQAVPEAEASAQRVGPSVTSVTRLWPYAAAAALLVAASLVLALVWRTRPQAASAEKQAADAVHVAQPAAAETTASAATQPVVTAIAPAAEAAATSPATVLESNDQGKTATPSHAQVQAPGGPARAKRQTRPAPVAPPAAASSPATSSPPDQPAPAPAAAPSAVDKNPLHMKLQ
jgi:eukaryotic-like serine/threonine-protein kinase